VRNLDEHSITDAVRARVGQTSNARVREISDALERHLHSFVRETEPTRAEWSWAIDFLTRTGQMGDRNRQEFILLSDALGVSMLVDAINHRSSGNVIETTVLGPFYLQDPLEKPLGSNISVGLQGIVKGTISRDGNGLLAGAVVDVRHSDGDGYYVQQLNEVAGLTMRDRLRTDANGAFYFWTVMPAAYPIPNDGPVGQMLEAQNRHPIRPAHVHFMISAPGYQQLVTHVFVDGDEYLDSDVAFSAKDTLIRPFVEHLAGVTPDGTKVDEAYAHLHYDSSLASATR
jgi:hydroxyquinol 1,2-dioxygenase